MWLILILLTGCPKPPCPAPPEFWEPDLEPYAIADMSTPFTLGGGAVPLPDAVGFAGPGQAALSLLAARGPVFRVSWDAEVSGETTLVVHYGEGWADSSIIDEISVDGIGSLDIAPSEPGRQLDLVFISKGDLRFHDFRVEYDEWAETAVEPGGVLQLGMVVHVETDTTSDSNEDDFRLQAAILERLAETLAAHGGRLTLQVDGSFIVNAQTWVPDFPDRIRTLGGGWSTHVHDETDGVEDLEKAARFTANLFREIGVDVSDFNGGFQIAAYDRIAAAGYDSLSAFKNPATQGGLPRDSVLPWRPPNNTGTADMDAFLAHDDEGPLVFLGGGMQSDPAHDRFAEVSRRRLSQLLAHTRQSEINTGYLVTHIDFFAPVGGDKAAIEAYFDDGGLDADLAFYDAFLTDTVDPLVEVGMVEWSTTGDMGTCWLERESACGR